jgi:hypothetical protein
MGELRRMTGGCLCGAVRFTAVPKALEMDVCHCSMCRRWSGGTVMSVPCTEVDVEDPAALAVYVSSDWAQREFCRTCGSSLFWRMRGGEGHVAVSMQAFDDVSPFAFAEEIFIDEKPALYAFAGERPRLTGAEVMAKFTAQQKGTA